MRKLIPTMIAMMGCFAVSGYAQETTEVVTAAEVAVETEDCSSCSAAPENEQNANDCGCNKPKPKK